MSHRGFPGSAARALAVACLAAFAGWATAPTAAVASHCDPLPDPTLHLGFNGQAFFIQTSENDYTERFLTEYGDLGARSMRMGIDWQVIEPNPGERFFEGGNVPWNYADIVTRFRGDDVEVQGLFNTFPAFVTESPTDGGPGYSWDPHTGHVASADNLQAMREIVRDTLAYFYEHGCITRWEFLNEPSREHPASSEPGEETVGGIGWPENYAPWFAAFLDGVALAEGQLAAGGHPVDFEIAMGAVDGSDLDSWTAAVFAEAPMAGRQGEVDAIAFHPYDRDDIYPSGLNEVTYNNGLAAANAHDLEIWITEFGYNDESGVAQRDEICQAVSTLDAEPRVTHANLHLLHDINEGAGCQRSETNTDPNCFGLINNDFIASNDGDYDRLEDRKLGWDAYRLVAQLLLSRSQPLSGDGSDCAPNPVVRTSPEDEEEVDIQIENGSVTFTWEPSIDPFEDLDGDDDGNTYQFTLYSCEGDTNNCNTPMIASGEERNYFQEEANLSCDSRYRWVIWARSDETGMPSRRENAYFTTTCGGIQRGALDFCFAVDTTGSMGPFIGAAKVAATAIVDEVFLVSSSPRVAVTDFRDFPFSPWGTAVDYPFRIRADFSSDQGQIVAGIQSLDLGNGRDFPESVFSGLIGCVLGRPGFFYAGPTLEPWREDAVKVIILMGDAPPHDPEPESAYDLPGVIDEANAGGVSAATAALTGRAATELEALGLPDHAGPVDCGPEGGYDGIRIFAIHIGTDPTAGGYYQALADGTCGRYLNAITPEEVVDAILEIIGEVGTLPTNLPPEVGAAAPSVAEIWPPNHKWTDVEILGVTDPEGDEVTITVTGITQDEPVPGPGKKHSPDGRGVGTSVAGLRGERDGGGNGRVYEISFTATDDAGASADGAVQVCVPHDRGGAACTDDGQAYDSTAP